LTRAQSMSLRDLLDRRSCRQRSLHDPLLCLRAPMPFVRCFDGCCIRHRGRQQFHGPTPELPFSVLSAPLEDLVCVHSMGSLKLSLYLLDCKCPLSLHVDTTHSCPHSENVCVFGGCLDGQGRTLTQSTNAVRLYCCPVRPET